MITRKNINRICNRCVMDTTDRYIQFDEKGYCNHCTNALIALEKSQKLHPNIKKNKIQEIITKIKKTGKGKKYDCIIGLSGGLDSSYLAYLLKKQFQLNPLAVHVDNGWDSELAVKNIENIVEILRIDLLSYVIDWEIFKDMQIAYLKASVIDFEVLSDNGIVIAIDKFARKFNIKYFISGFNLTTESIMPSSWLFSPKYDSLNIKSIYKRFGGGKKITGYPLLSFWGYLRYRYINYQTIINLLDLVDYTREKAINILKKEIGWRDYGGKHHESRITHFYQNYILPEKFNIDKRKAHLSSMICSDQISRIYALKKLNEPLYEKGKLNEDKDYFIKKLGLSRKDFEEIMELPICSHFDFSSYNKLIMKLNSLKKNIKSTFGK